MGASKIQSSPKCKACKKFCRAAYDLYVSKKFFTQLSITSHLVAIFWQPSGIASSCISWDEMWIFRGPPRLLFVQLDRNIRSAITPTH
jgi:hypothetical protein